MRKPFYVASESYKFARLYPLNQKDVPQEETDYFFPDGQNELQLGSLPKQLGLKNPYFDYTPPSYISLMFTDLGVLTPAAVSDELIKLYQ
jgi:translation initiation factor eIF-2B subunit alpha